MKAAEQCPQQKKTEQTTIDDVMIERNVRVREDDVEETSMHQERRVAGVDQEEQQAKIITTRRPKKKRKKKISDIPGCREKFEISSPSKYSKRCLLLEEQGRVFPKRTRRSSRHRWRRKCANPFCTNRDTCKASIKRSRCLSARQDSP